MTDELDELDELLRKIDEEIEHAKEMLRISHPGCPDLLVPDGGPPCGCGWQRVLSDLRRTRKAIRQIMVETRGDA